MKKNNWEFPPFPSNDLDNACDQKSESTIICYSRQTQTESKDWAWLELTQFDDNNQTLDETKNPLHANCNDDADNACFESKVNAFKVKLDKGTVTNDIPDALTRDQKLNCLRIKFAKAEHNHLNDILDACHEDYNWAYKVLSEFNDDHFELSSLEQVFDNSSPDSENDSNNAKCVENDVPFNAESDKTDNEVPLETDLVNNDDIKFVLTLDHSFATLLESQFGLVCDKIMPNKEDLTVQLSHGFARLLHHHWKKSFNLKFSTQSSSTPSHLAQSINLNHNNFVDQQKPKNIVLEEYAPKTEFQEIMDVELAMSLSRKEYDDRLASELSALGPTPHPKARHLLSTKIKRDQLYLRYPGVDKGFLDELFESNKFYLGKTIKVIDDSLGEVADFTKETQALLAEEIDSNGIRSLSPTKTNRKVIDFNQSLSEINALLLKRKEFHDKAHIAYQKKMFAVASYYGEEASKLANEIERFSRDIVDHMLTTCINSNEIDLHGLHVAEVNVILAEYLKRKLEELRKTPSKRKLSIDIITGYGATKGVQGRIKPFVIQYLKQKSYTYEMVNMGVVRVFLTQQTNAF